MEELDNKLALIKDTKFEITNIEKFSMYFVFIKQLKKLTETLEKEISKKGSEMMFNDDIKEIIVGDFKIVKQDPFQVDEFDPRSVFEALGSERAFSFFEVKTKALKDYLIMGTRNGAVSWQEATKCREKMSQKYRKSFLKLVKKK